MALIDIQKADLQRDGDKVIITGTVDGVSYTIEVWKSHLDTLATKALKRQYVAQQLKNAASIPTAVDLSGTPITL